MQPHGCVHIRMFILHAAIVPTCVGLHAASSMAHWCQFFPVLVCAARACCKQARTGGGKGCMHEMCPVGVHVCAAGLAFPCQTCLLNAGLCHRCMHVHICVQVSLGPMVVCVAYLVHSSWVPAVPCMQQLWLGVVLSYQGVFLVLCAPVVCICM